MSSSTAVVICAHAFDRLELTVKCVDSVLEGTVVPQEIFVVVDNNEDLQRALERRLQATRVCVLANDGTGASDARSSAIERTKADIVVFIDDDAWAESNWLEQMSSAFDESEVVGAGGLVVPDWAPGISPLPAELLWIVGSTYRGHPEKRVPITRPLGASMAARRHALQKVGSFPHEFGPRGGRKSSSNEELALFTRLREHFGNESVLYIPTATVHHFVPAHRATWRYVVERSWAEGTSKADIRRTFGPNVMRHDAGYVRHTLLPAIAMNGFRGVVHWDGPAARESALCLVSLCATVAGYVARGLKFRLTSRN
jgi:glycosyltransferase involved in cell wall biosynthesis